MDVSLKRAAETLGASWTFASWSDVGLLQGWAESLNDDSSTNMRDSADFARQAVTRWQGYADKHLIADSLSDVGRRSQSAPTEEFAVLLALKAEWWFEPEKPLAFAYFRRTWSGGLYLEFMAGHPLTEGRVQGILRATLLCLADISSAAGGGWVWWEATEGSYARYEAIVQGRNILASVQPRIQDVFIVRTSSLQNLLKSGREST